MNNDGAEESTGSSLKLSASTDLAGASEGSVTLDSDAKFFINGATIIGAEGLLVLTKGTAVMTVNDVGNEQYGYSVELVGATATYNGNIDAKNLLIVDGTSTLAIDDVNVKGRLLVEDNGKVTVGQGKSLTVTGTIDLKGDLELYNRACLKGPENDSEKLNIFGTTTVKLGNELLVGPNAAELSSDAEAKIYGLNAAGTSGFKIDLTKGTIDIKGGYTSSGYLTAVNIAKDTTVKISTESTNNGNIAVNGTLEIDAKVTNTNSHGIIEVNGLLKINDNGSIDNNNTLTVSSTGSIQFSAADNTNALDFTRIDGSVSMSGKYVGEGWNLNGTTLTLNGYNGKQYFDGSFTTVAVTDDSSIAVNLSSVKPEAGGYAIKSIAALAINISSGKTLSVDLTRAADDKDYAAIYSASTVTIAGVNDTDIENITVNVNGAYTKKVADGTSEHTYGIKATGGVTIQYLNVNITVSEDDAFAFAIEGNGNTTFTNVTGQITGGNRAIQMGGAALTFSGSELVISGGEKAIQSKTEDGTVSIQSSQITLKLNDPLFNTGTDDRYGLKVNHLNIDVSSVLITDGLRLYDIPDTDAEEGELIQATFTNNGILIVKGGYTQEAESDGTTSVPVAGFKSDSLTVSAYNAVPLTLSKSSNYLDKGAQTSGKVIVVPVSGEVADGVIVSNPEEVADILNDGVDDSVVITGVDKVDVSKIDVSGVSGDKTVTITGEANGDFVVPNGDEASVKYVMSAVGDITVSGITFSDISNVTITVTKDTVTISGETLTGTIELTEKEMKISPGTSFDGMDFGLGNGTYCNLSFTVSESSNITVKKGSIFVSGTEYAEDVLVLDENINFEEDEPIHFVDVSITGTNKTITVDKLKITGTVSIGAGVTIIVKENLTVGDAATGAAHIVGAGSIELENTDVIVDFYENSTSTIAITPADSILDVDFESDLTPENISIYTTFNLTTDVSISGTVSIPAGKIIQLNECNLNVLGTFSITDSKVIGEIIAGSEDDYSFPGIIVKDNGTFSINNSDVFANVNVEENGSVVIVKAKTQTVSGQSVSDTAVGYGNTLILDGVTIENGNSVVAYGNLEIKGTTKIAYGGYLIIGHYGNAKISGTMNVAGTVIAYGPTAVDGTVNVSGSKTKDASFYALGHDEEEFFVNVTKNGTLNIAKPSGTDYENALIGVLNVEGTLNMNGTFTGMIEDYGSIKINGTVNGDGEDISTIAIMDGVKIDITALYGDLRVTDSLATEVVTEGMDTGTFQTTDGNIVTLKNVKGVSISTEVTTKVNSTGTTKYFYADMTVSGTVSKTDKNLVDVPFSIELAGSITSSNSNNAIGPAGSQRYAQIYVADTLNIGKGVGLTVIDGTVVVDGTVNAVEEDSAITISETGTLTVNGEVIIGGKNNESASVTNNGTINAAMYTILDPVDFYRTYYYTTADAAIDKIADAEDKVVEILGTVKLASSKTIAAGQTLIIANGATFTVNTDVTLEAAKDSIIENRDSVSVKGTFIINDYDADYSGTEPSSDVLAKEDPKRTYTSLKGAIASGATLIILNNDAEVSSNITIPEGVLVTSEKDGIDITVKKKYTLTVEGALELPKGTVNLQNGTSTENAGDLVVLGHVLYNGESSGVSLDTIDGVHYQKKVNGKYQKIISSVEYAAENVDDTVLNGEIEIVGEVSGTDVVFTKGKNALKITVNEGAVLSIGSMKLVGVTLDIIGTMSGTVTASTGLQSDDTGATTDGIIELSRASGIRIVSKTIEAATGITDYMYLTGTLSGVATIASGTITVDDVVDDMVVDDLTVVDGSKDSKLVVSEGATLSVTGRDLIVSTSENGKANLVIEGMAIVSGTGNKLSVLNGGVATVSGTIEIVESGEVNVAGILDITGTVKVSDVKGKEGAFNVSGAIFLGEKPTILGEAGAAAKIDGKVKLNLDGYIKSYPGADLTTTKINWTEGIGSEAFSTSFVINDVTYMTIYTTGTLEVYTDIIDKESFELVGLFNGVNYADETTTDKDSGLYAKSAWYTDAAMSPNKKITDTLTVSKDLPAVYAYAAPDNVVGMISVGTGLNLFIDGVPVNSGFDEVLKVGTHTIRYDVLANYDGSKAVLSFNGQVISNGSTITIGAGDKTFSLTVSGAVPAESEIIVTPGEPSQPGEDDGMGLTDILLIVLVVLAAILVVVVAIRMMRS